MRFPPRDFSAARSATAATFRVVSFLTMGLVAGTVSLAGCSEDPSVKADLTPAAAQSDSASSSQTVATTQSSEQSEAAPDETQEGEAVTETVEPRAVKVSGDDTFMISGDQASFVMPSGNIHCVLRSGSAVCQIADKSYAPAQSDMSGQVLGDCGAAAADAITVLEQQQAAWTCTSGTIRGQAALGLGGWWAVDGVGGTAGITLARDSYRID